MDTGSGPALPVEYLGTWAGTGVEADQGVQWEVVLTLTGGSTGTVVGTSSCPGLGCQGNLTLIMFDQIYPPYAKLAETIVAGHDTCADGTFSIGFAEGVHGMRFSWTSATGTLQQIT